MNIRYKHLYPHGSCIPYCVRVSNGVDNNNKQKHKYNNAVSATGALEKIRTNIVGKVRVKD